MTNPTSTTELAVAIIYDTVSEHTLINTLTLVPNLPATLVYDDDDEDEDENDKFKDNDSKSTKFLMFVPADDHHRQPSEHGISVESYTTVDMVYAKYKALAFICLGMVNMEAKMVETKLVASRGTQPVWDAAVESVDEQRERLGRWAVDVVFENFNVDVQYEGEDVKEAAHTRVEAIRKRMELRVLEVDGDVASLKTAIFTLDDP